MLEYIHQSNLIENIDDHEEDMKSLSAWYTLCSYKELNEVRICEVHRMITSGQINPFYSGYFRSINKVEVRVGRYNPPPSWQVDALISGWLYKFNDNTPLANHIAFEHIHPFVDGNGRIGRMLMWWQEKQLGIPITYFNYEYKQEYYKLFRN